SSARPPPRTATCAPSSSAGATPSTSRPGGASPPPTTSTTWRRSGTPTATSTATSAPGAAPTTPSSPTSTSSPTSSPAPAPPRADASGLAARKDAILAGLWRRRGVDSLFAGRNDVQGILYGHAAGVAVERWWAEAAARHPGGAVLEAHGARAGVALLVVAERAPDVGTVFVANGSASAAAAAEQDAADPEGAGALPAA